MTRGALDGLRVLDCGEGVAAAYASSLLGHLGADVVKLEPPAGDALDALRRRGPFPGGSPDPETGGLHRFLDQTKRSVALDFETDDGQAELRRLAAAADVLLAAGSAAELRRKGLTYARLNDAQPRLIAAAITPFGLQPLDATNDTAPLRDLLDLAAGGWLAISPGGLTDPELPPLKPFGQQAHFQAGVHTAIAVLGAIAARDSIGAGQQVDVSVEAVISSQLESAVTHYTYGGRVSSRLGFRILGPWGMLQLADGLLFLVCVTEEEWQRLLQFLGHPESADSPLFADRLIRAENNDALLSLLEGELAGRAVQDTYVALQEQRIPCSPVNEMKDLLASPHLAAREFFVRQDDGLSYPGAQWKLHGTPWQAGRRAPHLGEHTGEVLQEWTATPRHADESGAISTRAGRPAEGRLPLDGVRVADFTWAWAGPTCTLQLAHLGADVIRIETGTRPDTVRSIPPFWGEVRGPNRSGYFNQYNQGKRSVTLNLKRPEALELAKEIVRRSDIVVDNFSAGVMERMGLGYDVLRQLRPDIIQVEMAAHGQTGPLAQYVAYGPTQVPMIGLASLTGYPGGGPCEVGISYGDPNGGVHAALGALAALHHRRRTGEGQYIDMSQWEAALPLVAEGLLTYQMDGKQPERTGNRDQFEAPQGVFRSAGPGGPSSRAEGRASQTPPGGPWSGAQGRASQTSDDQWVAVSCWSDAEWRALATAIGRPDLRDDPGLATREERKAREDELDTAISAWTMVRERDTAADELCLAGVPAFPVRTAADVVASKELAARGFWVELPHPECAGARHAGPPWLFSATPLHVRHAAPCVGEHTDEVLRELLELPEAHIIALREAGALA